MTGTIKITRVIMVMLMVEVMKMLMMLVMGTTMRADKARES